MSLPIVTIVGRATWFVLANFFTLFRLTWFPLALLVATEWAFAVALIREFPHLTFEQIRDADDLRYDLALLLALVVQGFALAIVAVQIHRVVLFGDRRPGHYFSFPFGWTECLYIVMASLTFVFAVLMVAAILIPPFALIAIAGGGTDLSTALDAISEGFSGDGNRSAGGIAASIVMALAMLLLWLGLIWLSMRLAVWPAAVVANRSLALGEAWSLTRGQALALLGMFILSVLAPAFVGGVIFYFLNARFAETGVVVPLDIVAPFGDVEQKIKYLLTTAAPYPNPNLLLVDLIARVLVTAYSIAIISFAYKALKGYDLDLPIDEQEEAVVDLPPGVKPMGAL